VFLKNEGCVQTHIRRDRKQLRVLCFRTKCPALPVFSLLVSPLYYVNGFVGDLNWSN
jgi:hypothetical protein